MSKEYLGDGAYAEFDGWNIILTTSNGIEDTNRIVMEPDVSAVFIRWLDRLKAECKKKNQEAAG